MCGDCKCRFEREWLACSENLVISVIVSVTATGPQLTLWVSTAGGSLGVFTITRDDEQGLILQKTGNYGLT